MSKKTKRPILTTTLLLLILLGVILYIGLHPRMEHKSYRVGPGSSKFMVLSDTHTKEFGIHEQKMLEMIKKVNLESAPIFFVGDIIQNGADHQSYRLIYELKKLFPIFYVTGNHEFADNNGELIKNNLRQLGVEVLAGNCVIYKDLNVCGIDDNYKTDQSLVTDVIDSQLQGCVKGMQIGKKNILLSHRPQVYEEVDPYGFDLIVSGHNHGGQWRVPFTNIGLISPEPSQSIFPPFTRGLYRPGKTPLFVSAGMSNNDMDVPRLFNNFQMYTLTI